jgi:predicted TIM-barrel fold metal-dependent hydrolase
MPCIDIHHHFFPPDLQSSKAKANQDLGWRTPPGHLQWSPELSLKAMDELGIDISILSFPAISTGAVSEENRKAARSRNEFAHRVCEKYPERFGFFASLPFLDDIEGNISVKLCRTWLSRSRMPG